MKKNKQYIAYAELTLSMILLSATFVIGKELVKGLPVFFILGFRFLIGSITLGVTYFVSYHIKDKKLIIPQNIGSPKILLLLFLQAFFGAFLFNLFLLFGLEKGQANSAAIITSTIPAFIAVFSFIILKEKINYYKWAAIILAITGLVIATANIDDIRSYTFSMGDVLVLIAVIMGALFPIIVKILSTYKITPAFITLAFNIIGLVLFLPFALYTIPITDFANITLEVWSIAVVYSVIANVLYILLWNRGLEKTSVVTASLFTCLMPISTVLISYILLRETVSFHQCIGILLVILSIFLGAIFG